MLPTFEPARPVRQRIRGLRQPGHRRKALPYICAGIIALCSCAWLFESIVDSIAGQPEGRRRQLSIAGSGTCLADWESDNSVGVGILYSFFVAYMFLGLAVVCDDFFTESIEVLCEEMKLSEDVAGATFMAAGGSAPELFTSLLTVATTQNSAGVGTILGSAVFNLVVIISLSSLAVEEDLLLDYRPIVRDGTAYAVSIITMAVFGLTPVSNDEPVCNDALNGYTEPVIEVNASWESEEMVSAKDICELAGTVGNACKYMDTSNTCKSALDGEAGFSWWEAVVMTLMYFGYIGMMSVNDTIMLMIGDPPEGFEKTNPLSDSPSADAMQQSQDVMAAFRGISKLRRVVNTITVARAFAGASWDSLAKLDKAPELRVEDSLEEGDVVIFGREGPSGDDTVCGDTKAVKALFAERAKLLKRPPFFVSVLDEDIFMMKYMKELTGSSAWPRVFIGGKCIGGRDEVELGNDAGRLDIWLQAAGAMKKNVLDEEDECGPIYHFLAAPFVILMQFTIPPCTEDKHRKMYPLSFTMSIVWIAFLCLWMVLLAEKIGCIIGVNSFLMGLVVLAAGTSVPDALASVSVAKSGYGGMAVSNAIGSNVFDIMLGLGVPFSIYCAAYDKGGYASGDEVEVLIACMQLLVILAVVVVVMKMAKWKLTKKLGGSLMSLYFAYVIFNILVDREVIPLLEPVREFMDVELADCGEKQGC